MIKKPCLNCRVLTTNSSRCDTCQALWNTNHRKPRRPHYSGDYRKRAKEVRDTATYCWICGEGNRGDADPFTADHVITGDIESPLLAAHRSCNSRRGAQVQAERRKKKGR